MLEVAIGVDAVVLEHALGRNHEGRLLAGDAREVDPVTFVVLTLALGINEKVSTPTTVIIMAINSVVGFAIHGLIKHDIGIAFEYWLVAVPWAAALSVMLAGGEERRLTDVNAEALAEIGDRRATGKVIVEP